MLTFNRGSRRAFLRVGTLGLGGLTLGDLLRLRAQEPKAASKSVIMIYLEGGPSHIDMYDLKPDAPADFRGEFKPIQTNVPGLDLSELMPLQAKIADKFSIVRGVQFDTGPAQPHSLRQIITGFPIGTRRPAFGSIVARLREPTRGLPPFVSLSQAGGDSLDSREDPAYLGVGYQPFTPGGLNNLALARGLTRERFEDRQTILHSFDYKRSRIKQYNKEGRALRTETTINDARDFRIGKRLQNLPALRQIGFQANRRLLDVQRISQDCALGEDAFRQVNEPTTVDGQRASALRFADPAVQALLSALLVFRLLPRGFSNRDLRDHWAPLLGKAPAALTPGQMTYHLRRLRLHGLIERIPHTHRYQVTSSDWRTALFCTRTYNRILRPGLAQVIPDAALDDSALRRSLDQLDAVIARWVEDQKVPA